MSSSKEFKNSFDPVDGSEESKNSRDPVDGSTEESKNSRDPVDGSKESKNSRDPLSSSKELKKTLSCSSSRLSGDTPLLASQGSRIICSCFAKGSKKVR